MLAHSDGARWLVDELPEQNDDVPLLLTFDDGGVSAASYVADALDRAGWRGHFFVTTDRIGTSAFLDARQIRELSARGHLVGTHSHTHPPRMSRQPWSSMVAEWRTSVDLLSDILGERVTVGSVPGGFFSRRVAEAAAVAGVTELFTSEPVMRTHSVAGCRVFGRLMIHRQTAPETAADLAAGALARRAGQFALWNAKKMAKRLAGGPYALVRRALLTGADPGRAAEKRTAADDRG